MNTPTNNDSASLSLKLSVAYVPNGVSMDVLKELLQQIAVRAIEEGMVTGHTDAEVADYAISVDEVPAPISEEAVENMMAQRIEDGVLPLEDIPNRLARYGLMERNDFVAEMHERLTTTEG